MTNLLLELFSEEIPARMQRSAAADLRRMMTDGLSKAGLGFGDCRVFWTPRRLTLDCRDIDSRSSARFEERKGPRVGASSAAVDGFVKSAGLASIEEAKIRQDQKRGDYYVAEKHTDGRDTSAIIADLVPKVIRTFPWPKSQRWGSGKLKWVRPLRSIVCLVGEEGHIGEIVNFQIDDIVSSNITFGHRFLAPAAIRVSSFEDYAAQLKLAKVVLDADERKATILENAERLANENGLQLVQDDTLLEEVSGLVEWPVVMIGEYSKEFTALPDEVIRLTIKTNQKCFVVKDSKGALANKFVLTANIDAVDGGREITLGNQKVVNARLSDAKFFWETDLTSPLNAFLPKLEQVTFHDKLGSQADRVARIETIAIELVDVTGADPNQVKQAARLCKADLNTNMVQEFGELQGTIGRIYAGLQNHSDDVATAIEEHYQPRGPADAVPTNPVAVAVALAEKIDLLTSFWSINETPTGSKDPYGLRRAALGVIRLVSENGLRLPLSKHGVSSQLLSFFHARLAVWLKETGIRDDVIKAAVAAKSGNDDLWQIVQRAKALNDFLDDADADSLMRGLKRCTNILVAAEKESSIVADLVDTSLFKQREENVLAAAVDVAFKEVSRHVEDEDYTAALTSLVGLRGPVDAFFDGVMVNDEDKNIRANRLALLATLRQTANLVASHDELRG